MADKKLPRDELEALRWFRQRLRYLTRTYPQLKTTKHQKRLAAYLKTTEEQDTCHESPQADRQADRRDPDTSTRPGV